MLLDVGVGILSALWVGHIFSLPIGWQSVGSGIVFSLLVDSDSVIDFLRHRGTPMSYRHRDLFHYPLIYVPLGMVIFYFIGSHFGAPYGPALSVLFGICSLAHFVHDSIGIGWGIAWLYPFSTDQYSFFYQYDVWPSGLRPHRGIYVWKRAEIDDLEARYGDKGWFRHIYLTLHPYGLVEWVVFVVSLIVWWRMM